MEDCVDCIGSTKFVSILDLLKGSCQVPLTPCTLEVSAFVMPYIFLQYRVMPFGLRNIPSTSQWLMHNVVEDMKNCDAYFDDVVIYVYLDFWEQDVSYFEQVFIRLHNASLVLNLEKCEFRQGTVSYLGKLVGHEMVKLLDTKVQAICLFPVL